MRGVLKADWQVHRFTDSAGSTFTVLGSGTIPVNVVLGTTYKLSLQWDPNTKTFTFGVDGQTQTWTSPDPINPPMDPNPYRALRTIVWFPGSQNLWGKVSATFDNAVAKDASGAVLITDDFSGSRIDPAKWNTFEQVREIVNGKFVSKLRNVNNYSNFSNGLILKNPNLVNEIQAKVTLQEYQNPDGQYEDARIGGVFYNDTGNTSSGYQGDVFAAVGLSNLPGQAPVARWTVVRFNDPNATFWNWTVLQSGTFPQTIQIGQEYKLYIKWDGTQFTFMCDDEVANYTPTTSIFAANRNFKRLDTRVMPPATAPASYDGFISATFDDVKVGRTGTEGTLSGQVKDASGNAIIDIDVSARDANGNWVQGTSTGLDGTYSLSIPAGSYKIFFNPWRAAGNFQPEYYNDKPQLNQADQVTVVTGQITSGIDAQLSTPSGLKGKVTDGSGNGVPNVGVGVHDQNNNYIGGSGTNSNGDYSFAVPPGTYKLFFYTANQGGFYAPEWYNAKVTYHDADQIVLTTGETKTINTQLAQGAKISGQVTDNQGNPIANVNINPHDQNGNWLHGTTTNASGNFTVTVPVGSWKIFFNPFQAGGSYISEWYNDKGNSNQADSINVTAGGMVTGINAQLTSGGTISGRVTNAQGQGVGNADVGACDPVTGNWLYGTRTDSSGNYSLIVPAGNWKIQFNPWTAIGGYYLGKWYNEKSNMTTADMVTVSAGQVTPNINAQLDQGGAISGRVIDAQGNGIPNIDPYAEDLNGNWSGGSRTDSQGNYIFTVAPGTYRVRFYTGNTPGYFLAEYYNDKGNNRNSADLVTVMAGQVANLADAQLASGGAIAGRVTNAQGTGLANICIGPMDLNGTWFDGTCTDSNGNYILNILPGTYKLHVTPQNQVNYYEEWYNHKTTTKNADPVTVNLGVTTPINVQLTEKILRTDQQSIADGISWLVGKQNPDGSWGSYGVYSTSLAVLILESQARRLGDASPFDPTYPYAAQVESGLNYLITQGHTVSINTHLAGNPDSNGNGLGIYFFTPPFPGMDHDPVTNYETSMALAAIASSGVPNRVVNNPISPLNGRTYLSIAQDTMEYLAWGQTQNGNGRGGWSYSGSENNGTRSDQSNSGWVTLGLAYAEAPLPEGFGLHVPDFVRSELDIWVNYIQGADGGSGYDAPGGSSWPGGPGENILKTGNLLQQMAFLGHTSGSPKVQSALNYLQTHWNDTNGDPGWQSNPANYQATYTTMKGLEALGIDLINTIDWFADFKNRLHSEQLFDGSWPPSMFDDGQQILSTEWALLTLMKTIPPTLERPDLVIQDLNVQWVSQGAGTYQVQFTVKNRGNVVAPAGSDAGLYVDGSLTEQKVIPQLAPGGVYSDSFAVLTNSGITQKEIKVCADINQEVDELNEGNNCSLFYWPPGNDLSISKTASPDPVTVGNNLTYTLTVTNNGHSQATGVMVNDTLGAGLTFVSATPSQGNCTGTSAIVCNLSTLANGANATVTIVVTVNSAGTITNTATVSATEADPNLANNTISVSTTSNPLQDITPPSLAITSHTDGQQVTTANITVSGTASDSGKGDNGIQQVTVNGSRASNDTATGSGTANWSKQVSLNCGANGLNVAAMDNSTNHNSTAQSITINYNCGPAAPNVPLQVLINNGNFAELAWGMVAGATDNYDPGIDQVASPASPDGDDSYFVSKTSQGSPYDRLWKDYRGFSEDLTVWKLILKASPGKALKVTWNLQDLLADWTYTWQKADSTWAGVEGVHNLRDNPREIVLDNTQGGSVLIQRVLLKASKGFPLSLKAGGWNLISLPIDPTDTNPATLFGANLIAIYEWNAVGKLYAVPTAVKSKTGFWVAVSQDTDLVISGNTPADIHVPVVIGWNLVGPVGNQPVPSGPSILAVYGWGWPPDYRYIVPSTCEEGKGFWIAVSAEGDIW